MWKQHLFSLIRRAIANTLTVGGSTLAGVIVVGVIGIFLGFIATLLIEGFRSKWNSEVMKAALSSWPPYVGAMGGVLIAWMFLFAWSIGATVYRDHISLASENVALKGRVCPALNTQLDEHDLVIAGQQRFGRLGQVLGDDGEQLDDPGLDGLKLALEFLTVLSHRQSLVGAARPVRVRQVNSSPG